MFDDTRHHLLTFDIWHGSRAHFCTADIRCVLAELHADLFSRHASPSVVYAFAAVDERGEEVFRRDLSSIPRETAKEEWRPKCAAPRMVYGSTLSFETFMNVYVRTTYDQIHSTKKEEENQREGQVSGWGCRTCVQNCRVYRLKTTWTLGLLCGKRVIYLVAYNDLVLV